MFCGFRATAFWRYFCASSQLPLSRNPPPYSALAKNFEARQPLDLGVPRPDQMIRPVVGRVALERLHAFVVNDLGEAHALLAAFGARQPAQRLPDGEVPIRPVGVYSHRGLAVRARHDVEAVPDLFGGVVLALDLLRDVDGLAPRLPQGGVVRGIVSERGAIVPQRLLRREGRVRAVAQRDVLRHRGLRLGGEHRGQGEADQQGRGAAHRGLREEGGR